MIYRNDIVYITLIPLPTMDEIKEHDTKTVHQKPNYKLWLIINMPLWCAFAIYLNYSTKMWDEYYSKYTCGRNRLPASDLRGHYFIVVASILILIGLYGCIPTHLLGMNDHATTLYVKFVLYINLFVFGYIPIFQVDGWVPYVPTDIVCWTEPGHYVNLHTILFDQNAVFLVSSVFLMVGWIFLAIVIISAVIYGFFIYLFPMIAWSIPLWFT
jgi:hypothetical protein